MEILKVQNLCKTYGKGEAKVDALKNVSFSLEKGEFAAVVGESGSGKSTLAKIIMGIVKPDSGQILLNGEDITHLSVDERAKKGVGFAFQSPVRFKGLTVYDLLKIAVNKEISKKEGIIMLVVFCCYYIYLFI